MRKLPLFSFPQNPYTFRMNKTILPLMLCAALTGAGLFAQARQDTGGSQTRTPGTPAAEAALPLRRLSLFSSGVGYFEH